MLKIILLKTAEWTYREESTSYRKKCWFLRIFQNENSRTPWDSEENLIISSDSFDIQEPTRDSRHPFKIRKAASALNLFTNQYTIEGRTDYNPQSLLTTVKRSVISLLSNNRFSDNSQMYVWKNKFAFRSNTEIILEVTNFDELYKTWTSKILESIDHFRIVSIRPGWGHSQRRVGVNITIPLHWPSCEWTLTLPIFLVCVRYQQ